MILHYQCPNCAGNMSFDADTGLLTCPSCGHEENVEQHPEELITAEFEDDDAKEYNCNNCGAILITDADTVATHCNFCGSNVVLADRVSGSMAPAKVIPLRFQKKKRLPRLKNGVATAY